MDLQISGKHALVTGGSRGLGKQSALALGNEGVNISICARGKNDLANTVLRSLPESYFMNLVQCR